MIPCPLVSDAGITPDDVAGAQSHFHSLRRTLLLDGTMITMDPTRHSSEQYRPSATIYNAPDLMTVQILPHQVDTQFRTSMAQEQWNVWPHTYLEHGRGSVSAQSFL